MTATRSRGLLDASAVLVLGRLDPAAVPAELAVAATTLAELAAAPHSSGKAEERARRQDVLQRVEATFEPLPFDAEAARAFGIVCAAAAAAGRRARGTRVADLHTAAIALSLGVPVCTTTPRNYRGLEELISVVEVRPTSSG